MCQKCQIQSVENGAFFFRTPGKGGCSSCLEAVVLAQGASGRQTRERGNRGASSRGRVSDGGARGPHRCLPCRRSRSSRLPKDTQLFTTSNFLTDVVAAACSASSCGGNTRRTSGRQKCNQGKCKSLSEELMFFQNILLLSPHCIFFLSSDRFSKGYFVGLHTFFLKKIMSES